MRSSFLLAFRNSVIDSVLLAFFVVTKCSDSGVRGDSIINTEIGAEKVPACLPSFFCVSLFLIDFFLKDFLLLLG